MVLSTKEKKNRFEYIKQECIKRNMHLLSLGYGEKIQYICELHPELGELEISWYKFKDGQGCKKCGAKKAGDVFRKTIDDIKKYFDFRGCILISTEYENQNTPLVYRCKKHYDLGDFHTTYASYYTNIHPCKYCFLESEKYTYKEVKGTFESKGLTLISTEYLGTTKKLEFICNIHNKIKQQKPFYEIVRGRGCNYCAWEKMKIKISGENNYNWKGGIEKENIKIRKTYKYKQWRESVFQNDNYTCIRCNHKGGYLNAHHKDGYNWCKARRFDVSNGATLCGDCHSLFHKIYGKKNNTEKQFQEFLMIDNLPS